MLDGQRDATLPTKNVESYQKNIDTVDAGVRSCDSVTDNWETGHKPAWQTFECGKPAWIQLLGLSHKENGWSANKP